MVNGLSDRLPPSSVRCSTSIIATHDEIADAMGISPNHVDTFTTLSHGIQTEMILGR